MAKNKKYSDFKNLLDIKADFEDDSKNPIFLQVSGADTDKVFGFGKHSFRLVFNNEILHDGTRLKQNAPVHIEAYDTDGKPILTDIASNVDPTDIDGTGLFYIWIEKFFCCCPLKESQWCMTFKS